MTPKHSVTSKSDIPETIRALRWTTKAPTDTGKYQAASIHTGGGTLLFAEFTRFDGHSGGPIETMTEAIATLALRECAQGSDGRIMPPEMRE